MKHLYKIFLSLAVIASFSGCDNSEGLNEGKFDENPRSGWVEFFTETTNIEAQIDNLDLSGPAISTIPVAVNVPINENDLAIRYSLVPVSGADPNTIFSNSGILIAEGGKSSNFGLYYPEIEIDLTEAANISEIMVFDVVLTSTNRDFVTAGISGSDRLTSVRYQICPTLDISTNQFLGEYNITTSASLFGGTVFTDTTVTLVEGPNGPFSRQFDATYIGAAPTTVDFTFVDGEIIITDDLFVPLGCSSAIFLGGDSSNILQAPCGDSSITLNMIDFLDASGGCGVSNEPFTVVLTKI